MPTLRVCPGGRTKIAIDFTPTIIGAALSKPSDLPFLLFVVSLILSLCFVIFPPFSLSLSLPLSPSLLPSRCGRYTHALIRRFLLPFSRQVSSSTDTVSYLSLFGCTDSSFSVLSSLFCYWLRLSFFSWSLCPAVICRLLSTK